MKHAEDEELPDSRTVQSRWNGVPFLFASILVLVFYFASIGPVFKIAIATHGIFNEQTLRTMYRPMFAIAPESTSYYLRIWGVSDLEAFFVMQSPKLPSKR